MRTIIINEHGIIFSIKEDGSIESDCLFEIGDRVRKKPRENAGEWQGHVVGAYSTVSGIGLAVRSEREKNSVQIYPESTLEFVKGD